MTLLSDELIQEYMAAKDKVIARQMALEDLSDRERAGLFLMMAVEPQAALVAVDIIVEHEVSPHWAPGVRSWLRAVHAQHAS
jgi:hypothetical protein